ncbi:unnamed protein product [Protopolystoma xenopodis]|uniref:Uncharacterized protein n=1 Tax=Protopolystoma xenopodis TaxID=117903 RepID=A0A3S5FD87_9PLAT|nr:unnamed protein product [Protopolystoma xenopodis]
MWQRILLKQGGSINTSSTLVLINTIERRFLRPDEGLEYAESTSGRQEDVAAMRQFGVRISPLRDSIRELRSLWSCLTLGLNALSECLERHELVHRLVFDASQLEAWLSEQELHLLTIEIPKELALLQTRLRKLFVS